MGSLAIGDNVDAERDSDTVAARAAYGDPGSELPAKPTDDATRSTDPERALDWLRIIAW